MSSMRDNRKPFYPREGNYYLMIHTIRYEGGGSGSKGISPLLATVLLIAITVATTTMLSGWISSTMSTTQTTISNRTSEGVACAAAEIIIDDVYTGKGSGGIARTIVRNSGMTDNLAITSAQLYDRIGHNFTSTSSLPISLSKGQITTLNFTFPIFGSMANDSSLWGNNGSLRNNPTYTMNGKFDSALVLDGINDGVNLNNSAIVSPSNVTVEAWIKSNSWVASENYIISKECGTPPDEYMLRVENGELEFITRTSDGAEKNATWISTAPSTGSWHFVVGTYDGAAVSLYVDGNLTARNLNGTGALRPANCSLMIGNNEDLNRPFNGTIDEVALWNRSLTSTEINASMVSGNSAVTTTNDLMGYWKFDEGKGILSCPSDFSRVVVTTSCGGVSAEFSKPPKC